MARILVVDDDAQIRGLLRMTLERAGYETDVAADGGSAVRIQQDKPADVLITDIMMPERDGLETIMDFRRQYPQTKIIAISGAGCRMGNDFLPVAAQLGASRTFVKPIERVVLLDTVRELLDRQP